MIELYVLMVLPGIALLWAIQWVLKKIRVDRSWKIRFFIISSVAILTPFWVQVDIALVVGPAYIAVPMGISGGLEHFFGLLTEAWMFHLIGFGLVALVSAFISSRFLFRSQLLKGRVSQ